MKTIDYITRRIPNTETEVTYSVTVDELYDGERNLCAESYGIKVTLSDGESETARSISTDADTVTELIELLAMGCVTPCTLLDVVYDVIG